MQNIKIIIITNVWARGDSWYLLVGISRKVGQLRNVQTQGKQIKQYYILFAKTSTWVWTINFALRFNWENAQA